MPKNKNCSISLVQLSLKAVLDELFRMRLLEEKELQLLPVSRQLNSLRKYTFRCYFLSGMSHLIIYFYVATFCLEKIVNAIKIKTRFWIINENVRYSSVLSLLITSHTRVLDLPIIQNTGYADFCRLLHLASKRCPVKFNLISILKRRRIYYVCYWKGLQTLKVTGYTMNCEKIAEEVFPKKILSSFTHLQELHVIGCEVGFDDTCMEILGTYCRDLR